MPLAKLLDNLAILRRLGEGTLRVLDLALHDGHLLDERHGLALRRAGKPAVRREEREIEDASEPIFPQIFRRGLHAIVEGAQLVLELRELRLHDREIALALALDVRALTQDSFELEDEFGHVTSS